MARTSTAATQSGGHLVAQRHRTAQKALGLVDGIQHFQNPLEPIHGGLVHLHREAQFVVLQEQRGVLQTGVAQQELLRVARRDPKDGRRAHGALIANRKGDQIAPGSTVFRRRALFRDDHGLPLCHGPVKRFVRPPDPVKGARAIRLGAGRQDVQPALGTRPQNDGGLRFGQPALGREHIGQESIRGHLACEQGGDGLGTADVALQMTAARRYTFRGSRHAQPRHALHVFVSLPPPDEPNRPHPRCRFQRQGNGRQRYR